MAPVSRSPEPPSGEPPRTRRHAWGEQGIAPHGSEVRQFLIISALLLGLLAVGTMGIGFLTELSWFESAYLALITLTTVGSRDIPESPPVMMFVMAYLVVGLSVFTFGAFQVGQLMVNANFRRMWELRRMNERINRMNEHFIVCGLGRMGLTICEFLETKRKPFVVVDTNQDRLHTVGGARNWTYLQGDATDDEVLRQAGIDRAASLATVLPTDADNVYVVLSARLMSPELQIVARAEDNSAIQKLQKAGATRVISPFSSGAVKMARFMISPSIEDFLEITGDQGGDLELAEVQIDADSRYVGSALAESDLRQQGVMVIGIRRMSGEHLLAPKGDTIIEAGDRLFVFGTAAAVNSITSEMDD